MPVSIPGSMQSFDTQSNGQTDAVDALQKYMQPTTPGQPSGDGAAPDLTGGVGELPPSPGAFPRPGSFGDKLSDSLRSVIKSPAAPAVMAQPAGWAKMMIGATMDALSGKGGALLGNLGDAAAATAPVPEGGGALTGVLRTLGAGQQRAAAEKQQTFENKLKTDKAADEHLENEARVALLQGQTRLNAINVTKAENEVQDGIYNMNKTVSDQLAKNHHIEKGVSQAQLDQMLKANPDYLKTHRALPIGREEILDGSGKPTGKFDQMWDVITADPLDKNQHVQPDAKTASDWKAAGIEVDPKQNLSADDMITLNNRATGILLVKNATNKAREEALTQEQFDQVKQDMESPAVQHAISADTARPLQGLQNDYNLHVQTIKKDQQQIAAISAKNPNDPQLAQIQSDLANKQTELGALQHFMIYGVDAKMREDEQKARFEEEQAAWQNRRAAAMERKESVDKSLAQSYQIQNKEFDTMRKPISEKLGEYTNLQMGLDMRNAEGDAIVAPMLLKALVAGGGVRITQAEINMVLGARSLLGTTEAEMRKILSGQKFSDEQRQQIRTLSEFLQKKIQAKKQILEAGQASIDAADTVAGQRQAVRDTRQQIDELDAGVNANKQDPDVIGRKLGASQHVSTPDGKTTIYNVNNQWVTADGKPYVAGK